MTADARFRFGTAMPPLSEPHAWGSQLDRIEASGFSTITVPDHLAGQEHLDPLVAMAAIAVRTSLNVLPLVLCNDFRHPVVVHKAIATLDVMTSGRVELGLGAGWMETDYSRTGIHMDSPGVRIDRLAESVALLKQLFAGTPVMFSGSYYQVSGLSGGPRTVQQPHPPILLGGGGEKMLRLAAREADIVGLNANLQRGRWDEAADADLRPDRMEAKVQWVRDEVRACARTTQPVLQTTVFSIHEVKSGPERRRVIDQLARQWGVPASEVTNVPQILVGNLDDWEDQLRERRERWGLSYFVLPEPDSTASLVGRLSGS